MWEEGDRVGAWDNLKAYCESNGVRVFVGAPLSCIEDDDEQHWEWTKELMLLLGEEHIMGLSIGNELELLQFKGGNVTEECVERMWDGGYLWQRFTTIVAELDALGMNNVPVTSVFTGAALDGDYGTETPFMEEPGKALVTTFLRNATQKYGWRYVFTWNLYPYFDPNLQLDAGSGTTCNDALSIATCWGPECSVASTARYARELQWQLTGYKNHTLWIGETGWSFPRSVTLNTAMKDCEDWSSMETFQSFYEGFLKWDLTIDADGAWPPADAAFWFTVRDSVQFGYAESFGLIESCAAPECKLSSEGFQVAAYESFSAPEGMACLGPALQEGFADNGREECEDRCTQDASCAFYSFWNSTTWCLLTADCCLVADGDPEVAIYARQTGSATEACPAYEDFSAPEGMACLGPALQEGFADNGRDECELRCRQDSSCAFYSFWNSTKWCRLTADCCLVADGNPEVVIYTRQTGSVTEACPTPSPTAAPTLDTPAPSAAPTPSSTPSDASAPDGPATTTPDASSATMAEAPSVMNSAPRSDGAFVAAGLLATAVAVASP
jgi:hypothetical protein